jgi:hypothetical protein
MSLTLNILEVVKRPLTENAFIYIMFIYLAFTQSSLPKQIIISGARTSNPSNLGKKVKVVAVESLVLLI